MGGRVTRFCRECLEEYRAHPVWTTILVMTVLAVLTAGFTGHYLHSRVWYPYPVPSPSVSIVVTAIPVQVPDGHRPRLEVTVPVMPDVTQAPEPPVQAPTQMPVPDSGDGPPVPGGTLSAPPTAPPSSPPLTVAPSSPPPASPSMTPSMPPSFSPAPSPTVPVSSTPSPSVTGGNSAS